MYTYDEILETMRERYRALSGFDADDASDIGIRLRVLAHQIHQIAGDIEELQNQVFVQTSTGEYLEMHAQTRGITRKQATPSAGVLEFYRESPALSDIAIAEGVLCSTKPDPQVQFETAKPAVLPAGETSVAVEARAADAGAIGNVAAGSVCLMVTPAPGISGVRNPEAFSGGVDAESDGMLRERLLSSFANISNGTNAAYYYDLAMQREEVFSANVLARRRGRGTVDVIIACRNSAVESEVAAGIQAEMRGAKEINVDVVVEAAVRDVVDISAEISILDGCDPQAVLAECEECIREHIDKLGVGDALLLAQLGRVLLAVDGVYNCRVLSPFGDVSPGQNHIAAAGTVEVKRMAVG